MNKKAFIGNLLTVVLVFLFILTVILWAIENPKTASVVGKEIIEMYVNVLIKVGKTGVKLITAMVKEVNMQSSNISINQTIMNN